MTSSVQYKEGLLDLQEEEIKYSKQAQDNDTEPDDDSGGKSKKRKCSKKVRAEAAQSGIPVQAPSRKIIKLRCLSTPDRSGASKNSLTKKQVI